MEEKGDVLISTCQTMFGFIRTIPDLNQTQWFVLVHELLVACAN